MSDVTIRKCGCKYRSGDAPAVKAGYELGGYLVEPCSKHAPKPASMSDDLIERLRAGLEGVTRGAWQVVELRHPWTLPARPEHGETETKHGEHVERVIVTSWNHPQTHQPWPVAMVAHGITSEPGGVVYFLAIDPADAAHIANCSPENIRSLLDALAAKDKAISEMRAELTDLHRAIIGGEPDYSTLSHGQFLEMIRTAEAARLGALDRATAAEAQLERARKALEPFAREAEVWGGYHETEALVEGWKGGPASQLTVDHLRAAAHALSQDEPADIGEGR